MGELFKATHTIDEMFKKMGVQIVLDGTHLSEEEKKKAEADGTTIDGTEKKEEKE